jgi:hypothetical protein
MQFTAEKISYSSRFYSIIYTPVIESGYRPQKERLRQPLVYELDRGLSMTG